MTIQAAGVETTHKQTSFALTAEFVKSRQTIVATFDPLKTSLPTLVETQIFSAEHAGDLGGFGHPCHKAAQAAWAKHKGEIEVFMIFQDEVAGAQATGSALIAGTGLAQNQTLAGYINDLRIPIELLKGDLPADGITKLILAYDALSQDKGITTTQLVNATPEQVDFTAKSTSTYGNGIIIDFAIGADESLPPEWTIAVTPMAGGTGIPDIQEALDILGLGANQNKNYTTDFNHTYGKDTTTWDAVSEYNGVGLAPIGNWKGDVHKPFTCLKGDNIADTAGFTAATGITDARRESDRTNGMKSVPGSPNHEDDIGIYFQAGESLKRMVRPSGSTIRTNQLEWIIPGQDGDRWTDNETADLRTQAVNKGLGITNLVNGVIQNLDTITCFRPASINENSNSYRTFRSIGVLMNMVATTQKRFEGEDLKDKAIVEDTGIVKGDLAISIAYATAVYVSLIKLFGKEAWIYSVPFALGKLNEAGSVTLKDATNGFNGILKSIVSGEPAILTTEIQTDNSAAVLTN